MTDPFSERPRTADLLPFRQKTAGRPTAQRAYDRILADIRAADAQLLPLVEHRRELGRKLTDLADACWPMIARMNGYKPPVADELPFPDAREDAEEIAGSRLRSVAMTLLARYGRCRLRTLHALLLIHGFRIASRRPVKALADALNHEVLSGRAVRVERATYAVAQGFRPAPGRFGNVTLVPATPWVAARLGDDVPSPIAWT